MANKKIRMRPEGTNDYADVLHPETTASVVIEETDKRFMTDAERTKLSGIATNANNYTHPASHPASMITESSTKRFVSDSEKATWNSKSDTDTVTTINGKTGAISKADIVALGVPAQDTTYGIATTSANGLMSSTDKQNLNANTTSRHTHINKAVIDKFSEVDNKPYYDGVEIGGGSIVLGTTSSTAFRGDYGQTAYTHSQSAHAPANAQKNSDITKAEIEAKLTGIVHTHTHPWVASIVDLGSFNDETELITYVIMNQLPGGHYTFIIDDVPVFMLLYKGLTHYYGTFHDTGAVFHYFIVSFTGEIQELKTIDLRDFEDIIPLITDMFGVIDSLQTNFSGLLPASGGVLENYTERLDTVSTSGIINLNWGNVFQHTPSGNTTYSITNPVSGVAHSFTLIINMGETARTLTFPASVKWQGGEIPDLTTANKTYVLTFMTVDGGTNWLGMFGGEF